MAKVSPTQRTLAELRKRGYLAAVVEKFNIFAKVRQDLFGFIDVLAVRRGEVLGVQATSASNVSARVKKIAEHANVGAVRESGIRIAVWGWDKSKLREVDCS